MWLRVSVTSGLIQAGNKMNLFGKILILFLSFQGIFPGKFFLVETKDKEARWWSFFFSYHGSGSIPTYNLPFSTVTEDEDEQADSSSEEEEEQKKGKTQDSDSYEEQEVIFLGKFKQTKQNRRSYNIPACKFVRI